MSLGLFFLRVLIHPLQRAVVNWIIIIFTTYSVGYFFFAVFQCGVPSGSRFWQRKLAHQCAPDPLILGLGFGYAVLTAGSDLVFVCLTIPMLRQSSLRFTEKWVVGGIMILGTT
jgi:hypothetical protein